MVINFKTHGISRGALNLVRTPTLIKKKKKMIGYTCSRETIEQNSNPVEMASNPWAMNEQALPYKRGKIHSVHSCIRPAETRNQYLHTKKRRMHDISNALPNRGRVRLCNILITPRSKTTQGFKN
jgi:hypothetical protein